MNNELYDLFNKQMNFETYSGYIYLDMSAYCSSIGLDGFAKWYRKQYQEELEHAKKFHDYIVDSNLRPTYSNWEESPTGDYASILDTAQLSLAHEKTVTARINYLMEKAIELKDYASVNFLNWFVSEQVEEEQTFNKMIDELKLVKDSGLYILDKDYGNRED